MCPRIPVVSTSRRGAMTFMGGFQKAQRNRGAEAQRKQKVESRKSKVETTSLAAKRRGVHYFDFRGTAVWGGFDFRLCQDSLRLCVSAFLRNLLLFAVWFVVNGQSSLAQTLDKGHQILVNRGIQLQGLVINYDLFHLSTLQG